MGGKRKGETGGKERERSPTVRYLIIIAKEMGLVV
jgi:hypothetical protein